MFKYTANIVIYYREACHVFLPCDVLICEKKKFLIFLTILASSYNNQTFTLYTYHNIINETLFCCRISTIYSDTSVSQQYTYGTIFMVFFSTILILFAITQAFFNLIIIDIKYRVYLG